MKLAVPEKVIPSPKIVKSTKPPASTETSTYEKLGTIIEPLFISNST